MEVLQDIYLKFTSNGAYLFLEKIKKGIPEYYEEQHKKYSPISEPEDWKDIDAVLHEKKVKRVKKILYDEIYLFSKYGENKHTGEVKFDVLKGIFEIFFKDELNQIYDLAKESFKLNEQSNGLNFLTYGVLIRKNNSEATMLATKVPIDIISQEWSMYSFWEENELDKFGQTTGRKIHGVLESFVKFEDTKITIYYMDSLGKIEKFTGKASFFESSEQNYIGYDTGCNLMI